MKIIPYFFPKRFFLRVIILLMTIMVFGCTPRYGVVNSCIPVYFTKPSYRDSAMVSATYIGGNYTYSGNGYNYEEPFNFGEIYTFRSHTKKYFNFSYGIFGYTGNYYVKKTERYLGNKSLYGGGFSGEFNFSLPFENMEVRMLGVRGTLLYEDGEFDSFRRKASEEKLIKNIGTEKYLYNLSITSNIDFKSKNLNYGAFCAAGYNFDKYMDDYTLKASLIVYCTLKRYTFTLEPHIFGVGYISLGLNYKL